MSSRRGGIQFHYQLFNSALFLLLSLQYTTADGNVGCLYYKELCDSKTETCFDDDAFGRCVYQLGYLPEDLYRYKFEYNDFDKLKRELEELVKLGFTWEHAYTQCIVQTQLYAVRFKLPYDDEVCEQILKQEISDPIRALQYEKGLPIHPPAKNHVLSRPSNEGIVKYEPDDEVRLRQPSDKGEYYAQAPLDYENELLNQLRIASDVNSDKFKKSVKSTSSRYRGTPLYEPIHNRKSNEDESEDESGSESAYFKKYPETGDWSAPQEQNVYNGIVTLKKALNMMSNEKGRAYTEGGPMTISNKKTDYENAVMYDKLLDQYGSDIFGFQRRERLDVKKPGPYYKVNNYAFKNVPSEIEDNEDKRVPAADAEPKKKVAHRNVNNEKASKEQKSDYDYVPNYGYASLKNQDSSTVTIETNNNLTQAATSQLIGTLKSIHRLPSGAMKNIRTNGNKITFTVGPNIVNHSPADIKRLIEESANSIKELDIKNVYVGLPSESKNIRDLDDLNQFMFVDADYAYIQLKTPIKNWIDAKNIVELISRILTLPKNTFYDIKRGVSEIAFKVHQNPLNLNASEVARKIDLMRSEINHELHIEIVSVGIGDEDKIPTAVHLLSEKDNSLYKLTFVICGAIGAVLVSALALFYIKKQSRGKDKLLNIPHEKELSKDYQECRNRLSGKSNQDSTASGQRITSLSRESDNSPSSRSSTSSWSEEPMTNMDITTGHMVLAYMEDHLNNKARLDTEWAALCAYDADPCSVNIAQLQENIRKNRYINALPYDHARVILNALSNVNGSDYINASTITDHDPRNAAYIATQGPLENTVCDFWQMIWEQGCVVIVMLTRLVENDTSMCHRYWPLEGAELYNIYEVHLVSEHIWCDDFLVRSFYLKNLKTTETRTVTQFHFLTWPEGGIPSATKPLLEFRRKVNKSFRGRSCPIVVHCSDGVGRTGSYLLLDMVLNRISKGAKEIDIAATLEHIRDQRAGAVCTKQQFQFVLSAVAEEVQAVLRALPQQQQATQDQTGGADNAVAPLVQVSCGDQPPPEPVATTSGVDTSKTIPTTSIVPLEPCSKPLK